MWRGWAFMVVVWAAGPGIVSAEQREDSAVFPAELVSFSAASSQAVFDGLPGAWDTRIRERGWILFDHGTYRLWYTGYDGTADGIRRLGMATSDDGIHWQRLQSQPLLSDVWVEDMMVVPGQGKFWMFAEGRNDQAQLLASTDGREWTRIGRLDVRLVSGQPIEAGPYGTPTAWFEDGHWYLFYERHDLGVWLARSDDLQVWTHVQDDPVLVPGPAEYDRDMIALNQIIKYGNRYYAYYHGCAKQAGQPTRWCTCIATSTDLIHWQKYTQNPLLPVADNVSSGVVVPGRDRVRLYTMHPNVRVFESPTVPTSLDVPAPATGGTTP